MTDPNPIDALTREHTVILQVVHALHALRARIEQGMRVDTGTLRAAAEFFREYADALHHGKEEAVLFPAMERKGVPESGCPLGALRAEHVKGRRLVVRFSEAIEAYDAGDPAGASELIAAIDAIHKLYPDHIWKEDEMVFPMISRLFGPADLRELQKSFEQADLELEKHRDRHVDFAARIVEYATDVPS